MGFCRRLRVNRLATGKDYGYLLDYRGVLGKLIN
jgi:hypothetical protein